MNASLWDAFRPPLDISTEGYRIDELFMYTTYLNLFWFGLVCIGLFGFCIVYRSRKNLRPYYTFGNKKPHLLLTALIGLAVFLSVDVVITKLANDDLSEAFWNYPDPKTEDVYRVEVLAQQWMWNFRHPGADNLFNTADDIVDNHELHIPVGRKVEFRITSKDVIHSLFFPNARLKTDAIPGRITRLWFEPTMTGMYDIACAEMCGTNHYLMQAKLIVHDEESFNKWEQQAGKIAISSNDTEMPDNYWGWKWEN